MAPTKHRRDINRLKQVYKLNGRKDLLENNTSFMEKILLNEKLVKRNFLTGSGIKLDEALKEYVKNFNINHRESDSNFLLFEHDDTVNYIMISMMRNFVRIFRNKDVSGTPAPYRGRKKMAILPNFFYRTLNYYIGKNMRDYIMAAVCELMKITALILVQKSGHDLDSGVIENRLDFAVIDLTDEPNHTCDLCDKQFYDLETLSKHVDTHAIIIIE